MKFDVAVVGAGIVGLAHAYEAARRGRRVIVVDRDIRANGASIRNFGFITVTGQERGESWQLARRTRDIWAEIAPKAGIEILQRGLLLPVRREESISVVKSFLGTEMGEGCAWLEGAEVRKRLPQCLSAIAALESPHELRVESRTALSLLANWLAESYPVTLEFGCSALRVTPEGIDTTRGFISADAIIVCAGDDFTSLYPERIAAYGLTRCRLSMMRLANPGFRLPAPVMSDLGLVRYRGYSELPAANMLRVRLQSEQAEHLAHGVHLIVTQSSDGTLVVGDSHHYDELPSPFADTESERLILDEFQKALCIAPPKVVERWTGTYAVASDRTFLIDAPDTNVRVVIVTSGTGASTGFGIAEKTLDELFGKADAA